MKVKVKELLRTAGSLTTNRWKLRYETHYKQLDPHYEPLDPCYKPLDLCYKLLDSRYELLDLDMSC